MAIADGRGRRVADDVLPGPGAVALARLEARAEARDVGVELLEPHARLGRGRLLAGFALRGGELALLGRELGGAALALGELGAGPRQLGGGHGVDVVVGVLPQDVPVVGRRGTRGW